MSHDNYNEQKIKAMLKELPQIQDDQSKEQLFSEVSASLNQEYPVKKRKRTWLIPSVASVAVIVLFVLIIQSSLTDDLAKHSEMNDSSGSKEFAVEDRAMDEEGAVFDETAPKEAAESESIDDSFTLQTAPISHVVYENNSNVTLIHTAVPDANAQYIIPFTLIDSSSNDELEEYYNRINTFINEQDMGVSTFPFDGITFDLIEEQKEVIVTIPDNYQLPGGSTMANMFKKIISAMFTPYQINEAIIESDSSNEGQLGPIGKIDRFALTAPHNLGYNIYQKAEDNPELLVPMLESNFENIEQALAQMQTGDPTFHIKASIPDDTTVTVKEDNRVVSISFTESERFGNNQETTTMIDAIVMSAKSFNFSEVQIELPIPDNEVGPYQLNETILVPEGVNPIYLH